jgi:hypothetical protein
MLAKISSGKSVFGVLAYNKIKADEDHAVVLYRHKMFDSPDGKFSMKDCMDSFYPYLTNNNRTEKVVFHASLNPPTNKGANRLRVNNEKWRKVQQVCGCQVLSVIFFYYFLIILLSFYYLCAEF